MNDQLMKSYINGSRWGIKRGLMTMRLKPSLLKEYFLVNSRYAIAIDNKLYDLAIRNYHAL